jgi:hypothetical protein
MRFQERPPHTAMPCRWIVASTLPCADHCTKDSVQNERRYTSSGCARAASFHSTCVYICVQVVCMSMQLDR